MATKKTHRTSVRSVVGRVVFERSGKWWAAELPSFPGAYGQGRTQVEAYRSLLSAIRDLAATYAEEVPKRLRAASHA